MPTTEGYNGAYTGQQIDEAIGKAQQIDEKISSHNESVDAHSEKFDEYLPLTGGTVTGQLTLGTGSDSSGASDGRLWFSKYDALSRPDPLSYAMMEVKSGLVPTPDTGSLSGMGGVSFRLNSPVVIAGASSYGYGLKLNGYKINDVGDPLYLSDAANKRYVDSKIPKAVTVTLSASSWSSNLQTVTVSGVSADEASQLIQPLPSQTSQTAYIDSGILCISQAEDSLTFSCESVPSSDINLYIVIQEVSTS